MTNSRRMLSNLQLGEFIYEQPAIGDVEYSFKHALTQEVAYNSLLTERRKELHRRTAVAIESLYAARLEDRYTELAHHWTQAGEPLRAATWHVRMARWVRMTDLAASRRHWARARALLVPLPWGDERTALLLKVYPELIDTLDRLGAEPAESEAVYLEAIAVARQAGEPRYRGLDRSRLRQPQELPERYRRYGRARLDRHDACR